jgi:uncharacterized membrane protein
MSSVSSSRWTVLFTIGTMFVLGLILRLYKADYGLFGDEFFTADIADRTVPGLVEQVRADLHPPLYFILVHYVSGLFSGEIGYRLLSIVAGGVSLVGLFFIARNEISIGCAVSTTVLGVLSPLHISYSQEARQYAFFFCIVVWATYFLLAYVHHGRTRDILSVAILSVVGLYTHYFYVLILIVHAGYLYFASQSSAKRMRQTFLLSGCMVFVLPWLFYALPVQLAFKETVLRPESSLMLFPKLLAEFTVGHTLFDVGRISSAREPLAQDVLRNLPLGAVLIVSFAGLFLIGTRRLYQHSKGLFALLSLLLLVSPTVMILMSYLNLASFASAKYSIASLLPLLIILGAGLEGIWVRRSPVSVVLAFLFLVLVGVSLIRYYFARDEFGRWEDWRTCGLLVTTVCQENHTGTIVLPDEDRRQYNRYFPSSPCTVTDAQELSSRRGTLREDLKEATPVIVVSRAVSENEQMRGLKNYLDHSMKLIAQRASGARLRIFVYSRNGTGTQ